MGNTLFKWYRMIKTRINNNNNNQHIYCDIETQTIESHLDKLDKCVVCQETRVSMILYPCSHYCLCIKCSQELKKMFRGYKNRFKCIQATQSSGAILCPVCRSPGYLFNVFNV